MSMGELKKENYEVPNWRKLKELEENNTNRMNVLIDN